MEDPQHVVEAQIFSPSNFNVGPSPVISPTDDTTKQKKRRVNRACVYCNRSHMSCDEERPCKRCVTRGIAHMCKDPDTVKRRGRKATYLMPEAQGYTQQDVHIETATNTPIIPTPLLNSPNVPSPTMSSSPDMILAGSIPSTSSDIAITTLSSNDNSPQNVSPSSLINYFLTSLDNIERYWSWASIENQPQMNIPEIKKEHNYNNGSSSNCSSNSNCSNAEEEFLKTISSSQSEGEKKSIRDFIKILRTRIPEESEQIITSLTQRRLKTVQVIREKFNVELDYKLALEAVKSDIEATIQTYRKLLEPLASPTIIYDRSGIIHYVNPAYRVLTGFSFTLPTEKSEFAFFKYILSPEALKAHFQVVMKSFEGWFNEKLIHAHIQPTAVRIHSELSEKYMEGMLAVNTKRDMFGMPFLFIGTFLPFVAPDPGIFIESHKDIHI